MMIVFLLMVDVFRFRERNLSMYNIIFITWKILVRLYTNTQQCFKWFCVLCHKCAFTRLA